MINQSRKDRVSCHYEITKEIIQENLQIEWYHEYPISTINDKRVPLRHITDKYSATKYIKDYSGSF